MKRFLLILLTLAAPLSSIARNDFWVGNRYSVSFSFGASDLGRKNAPVPKSMVMPAYPLQMMKAALEGEVVIRYDVTADGAVADIHVERATHEDFKASVLATFRNQQFLPAIDLETRKPTSARMQCRITFQIDESEDPDPAR